MPTTDGCPCPKCGANLNGELEMHGGDDTPVPGDVGICFYCTEFLIFDADLKQRSITASDNVGADMLGILLDLRNKIIAARGDPYKELLI